MDEIIKKINMPLTIEQIRNLKAGDMVKISGCVLGARDAAHKRLADAIAAGKKLPISLKGQAVFYVGPSPAPPGRISGGIGPTTSTRMDEFTEPLLKKGVAATIGKGRRTPELKALMPKYNAVYFIAPGGVAAYLSEKIEKIRAVAYMDLGPEAIYEIVMKDFPLFVAYDIYGGDIFNNKK